MNKIKAIKLIRVFFVIFILGGIGTIMDFYYVMFPNMFTDGFGMYDIIRLDHFDITVKMPGVPFILALITILVFVYVMVRLVKKIMFGIQKEN